MTSPESSRRFRDLVETYLWVARDHLLPHWRAFAVITLLGAGGALAQGSGIGLVALAVDRLEEPQPTGWALIDQILVHRAGALTAYGLGILAVLVLGSWATYAAKVRSRALARRYHQRCAERGLELVSRSGSLPRDHGLDSEAEFRRLLIRNSNHLGKAIESLVSLTAPLWRLVVATVILLWIDVTLSLVVAPLFLLLLPFLARINRRVRENSHRYFQEAITQLGRKVTRISGLVSGQNALPVAPGSAWARDLYRDDESIRDYFDEYDRLQLAQERVEYATSLGNSFLVAFAMLASGYLAGSSDFSYGLMMAYLLALLQGLNSLKAVSAHVTSLSIFFPAANQYRRFIERASPDALAPATREETEFPAELWLEGGGTLAGGFPRLRVERGAPVYLVSPHPLDALHLPRLLAPLAAAAGAPGDRWEERAVFCNHRGGASGAELEAALSEANRVEEAHRLQARIGLRDPGEIWNDDVESEEIRLARALLPLYLDPRPAVLLDVRLLTRIERDRVGAFLAPLEDRFIFLVPVNENLPLDVESGVIVTDDDEVIGMGDRGWFMGHREELRAGRRAEAESDDLAELAS